MGRCKGDGADCLRAKHAALEERAAHECLVRNGCSSSEICHYRTSPTLDRPFLRSTSSTSHYFVVSRSSLESYLRLPDFSSSLSQWSTLQPFARLEAIRCCFAPNHDAGILKLELLRKEAASPNSRRVRDERLLGQQSRRSAPQELHKPYKVTSD